MVLLLAKGLLAPVLLGACMLAARRWGALAGGWLLGLPLISGPVSFLLLVENGSGFASEAARGALLGMIGAGAFFVVYGLLARRLRWWQTLPVAGVAAVTVTVSLTQAHPDLVVAVLVAVGALSLITGLVGRPASETPVPTPGVHVVFARMAFASAMVVGVTLASARLGPQVSGMLTAVPVISATMAVATHRSAGGDSVRTLVSGAVAGLWGGATFFVVVAALVVGSAPVLTYAVATLAAGAAAAFSGALVARAGIRSASLPGYSA